MRDANQRRIVNSGRPLCSEQVADLVKTVREQLADLPTEDPVGSEDIYGLDTSIMFYTDDFRWANGNTQFLGLREREIPIQTS